MGQRILVTGGTGFLGHYVTLALQKMGAEVIPISKSTGYDLRNEAEALQAMVLARPEVVIHLAAVAGGLERHAKDPGILFRDNMTIGMNVVHATSVAGAKLVTVIPACAYPENAKVPFEEDHFWEGLPEAATEVFGTARKALLMMMRGYQRQYGLRFACLVPTNLYGPGQKDESYVIPSLIWKVARARASEDDEVVCWGTGKAKRSFLYVADAAEAIASAVNLDDDDIVNLPGSEEVTMVDLTEKIVGCMGYEGKVTWDPSKPEGQSRRVLDGSKAKRLLDWEPRTSLENGLEATIDWLGLKKPVPTS